MVPLTVRTSLLSVVLGLVLALLSACAGEPDPPSISLYRAVHSGDLDQLRRHLSSGTPIDQPDANGDLPLHVLARANRVVMARELLDAGADPEARNAQGKTPLEIALTHGKIAFARELIDHGARIDARQLLLEQLAAGQASRDTLDFLLDAGARLDQVDAQGRTPLHLAIEHLDTRLVARLLERGADVNQADSEGVRPLDLVRASRDRHAAGTIEQLLLRYGAQPSITPPSPESTRSTTPP